MTVESPVRNRWHAFIEALLPWYNPDLERRRNERTERIRRDAIAARIKAEQVREAYRLSAQRTTRR